MKNVQKTEHGYHEILRRRDDIKLPSNRSFGFTFAAVFFITFFAIGLSSRGWWLWLLALSAAFLLTALAWPNVLTKFNYGWFRFGLLLHGIVNPVVLGLLFAFITPIGIVWRAVKKDPLGLRFDAKAKSYWIDRKPPAPDPKHFPLQF